MRHEKEVRDMEDVTFKPCILRKSEILAANRKKEVSENIVDSPQRAAHSA